MSEDEENSPRGSGVEDDIQKKNKFTVIKRKACELESQQTAASIQTMDISCDLRFFNSARS